MFEGFQIRNVAATELRLMEIGTWLFSLRSEPILAELVCRLQTKDKFRSAFFETAAAAWCKRLGHTVLRSPGIQKKGSDFDFVIAAGGSTINVEVTELRVDDFDVQRVIRGLDKKRKQLPESAANILCCYLPVTWGDEASFKNDLDQVSDGLFRSSKRINALNFSMEQFVPGTQNVSVRYITHLNDGARNQDAKLNRALRSYYSTLSPVPTDRSASFSPSKQFDDWVESLIP
jgi:hypothetical protein